MTQNTQKPYSTEESTMKPHSTYNQIIERLNEGVKDFEIRDTKDKIDYFDRAFIAEKIMSVLSDETTIQPSEIFELIQRSSETFNCFLLSHVILKKQD